MKNLWALGVFMLCLFVATPGLAGKTVYDSSPDSLIWPGGYYSNRTTGSWSTVEGGADAIEGGYFWLSVGATTDGLLGDYSDIVSVKAEHEGTKREFYLTPSRCTFWISDNVQSWNLHLRPEEWMYEGTWKYILTYMSDDDTHVQTVSREMGPVSFPVKPSNVHLSNSNGDFRITWSGIGNPDTQPTISYRVFLFDSNFCGIDQLTLSASGGAGIYDPNLNRVEFVLPGSWSSQHIQLENRINVNGQQGRAKLSTNLPLNVE